MTDEFDDMRDFISGKPVEPWAKDAMRRSKALQRDRQADPQRSPIMTNPKDKTLVPVEQSDPFLIEIANAAVDANLHDDGSPKYGTAQGYACALEAARLTRLALASSPTPAPVSGEVEEFTDADRAVDTVLARLFPEWEEDQRLAIAAECAEAALNHTPTSDQGEARADETRARAEALLSSLEYKGQDSRIWARSQVIEAMLALAALNQHRPHR